MDEFFKKILEFGGTGALSAASALNPATAIMGAIPGVYQLGKGIIQDIQGDKLAKSAVRPVMNMTPAQQAALAQAFNLMRGEAPGSQAARDAMARSQAGSIAAIQNSGGGGAERLAALTRLNQNANTAAMDLGAMQQQFAIQQAMNYQNQLMQADETQKRQFLYNQDEPYRNTMAKAEALDTAGPRNIMEGLERLGRAGASAISQDVKVNAQGLEQASSGITPAAKVPAPVFNPDQGMDDYDFDSLTPAETAPPKDVSKGLSIPAGGGFDARRVSGQGEGRGNGMEGIIPNPYSANETGIQPADNTPIYPEAPSLSARIMDKQVSDEKAAYMRSIGMSRVNPALLGPAYRNVMKLIGY